MLKETENLLKAAGDRTRLRILKMLEGGPLCVCQIVEALGLSQSTVSRHLSVLSAAELVEDESRGKWTFYRIARLKSPEARRLLAAVRCCAADDPQVNADRARVGQEKIQALVTCCPRPRRSAREARRRA